MSTPLGSLAELLERERERLDALAEGLVATASDWAAGPLEHPLRYALAGGGKRLRGVLCVLGHRAGGGQGGGGIYDVALAIELVHTYSLVHDDLPCMDDDELRRGRPTVHRVFGSAPAALAGAALIPLAFRMLLLGARRLSLDHDRSAAMVRALARGIGAGGMVGGQWLDLEAEGRALDLAELTGVHAAKTGALFRATMELAGLSAGAAPPRVAALAGFGTGLGLAFQVVDDILDETADTAALGKTAGKDRRQEKATYPALLGREGARARAEAAVVQGVAGLRAAGIASAELEAVGDWVLARDH